MTATEKLRAMLDERGVEWNSPSGIAERFADSMTVIGDVAVVSEIEGSDLLRINFDGTPEQAIAATLGSGTCELTVLDTGNEAAYEHYEYIMHCESCHHEFGYVLYNEDGDTWMDDKPNYCPNCGKAVER